MPRSNHYQTYCSTSTKRESAAASILAALSAAGATVEIDRKLFAPKGLHIEAWVDSGHKVSITIEGSYDLDCFLVHWHGGVKYPVTFGADINGSVNPYHRCKATGMYIDLESLNHYTARGFEVLQKELADT